MLSQTKKNQKCFSCNFFPKNRKGISIMIGYILLISVAVVMGIIIHQWIKTYVPKEVLSCPEGVSIFIEEANYNEAKLMLNVTIKNNGNFNIAGYFIHATNNSEQELATIDLSNYTSAGEGKGGTVLFSTGNSLKPNEKQKNIFDLSAAGIGNIYSVEITPIRFQEEENKIRFVSCGNSKAKEAVTYWEACVPDCDGKVCGDDGCGGICPPGCTLPEICDGTGQCVLEVEEIVQIGYFGFESGEQGWSDPGGDSDRSSDRSKVQDDGTSGGSYCWHIQDNSGTAYTKQNFDFTDYSSITVEWWGYYESLENDECVEFKIDGIKAGSWGENGCDYSITEDTWLAQSITITDEDYTFDNSVEVSFEGEMSGNGDEFYFDGINITAVTT